MESFLVERRVLVEIYCVIEVGEKGSVLERKVLIS